MAAIRTQGGSVLLRGGKASCACCEDVITIGDINFGDTGNCDCETVQCYNTTTNPSPPSVTSGGIIYSNATTGTDRFVINTLYLQGPIYQNFDTTQPIVAWQNYVTQPSVMLLTGSVGGDIAIEQLLTFGGGAFALENGVTFPSDWNAVYRMVDVIPHEGEYPCGVCDTDRNGPHSINFAFVLWPYTYFRIRPLSYLECFPWYRLTLRRTGPLPP